MRCYGNHPAFAENGVSDHSCRACMRQIVKLAVESCSAVELLARSQRHPAHITRGMDPAHPGRAPVNISPHWRRPTPAIGIPEPTAVMIRRPTPGFRSDPAPIIVHPEPAAKTERRPADVNAGARFPAITVIRDIDPIAVGIEVVCIRV